jgi:hypothetical protein
VVNDVLNSVDTSDDAGGIVALAVIDKFTAPFFQLHRYAIVEELERRAEAICADMYGASHPQTLERLSHLMTICLADGQGGGQSRYASAVTCAYMCGWTFRVSCGMRDGWQMRVLS